MNERITKSHLNSVVRWVLAVGGTWLMSRMGLDATNYAWMLVGAIGPVTSICWSLLERRAPALIDDSESPGPDGQ